MMQIFCDICGQPVTEWGDLQISWLLPEGDIYDRTFQEELGAKCPEHTCRRCATPVIEAAKAAIHEARAKGGWQ